MKAIIAASTLCLSFAAFASPELVVKPALSESDVISVTVYGQHVSRSTPYYTRLFKQGDLQNSYHAPDSPLLKLEQVLPCVLDGVKYLACADYVRDRSFERPSAKMVELLHACALRMREFDMIDFKIAPEGNRILEIRVPDSCQGLVPRS